MKYFCFNRNSNSFDLNKICSHEKFDRLELLWFCFQMFRRGQTVSSKIISICSRRELCRVSTGEKLGHSNEQTEIEEKKTKQQKFQELEKLQYRPLYLDAQATTPMVRRVEKIFHFS